MTALDAWLRVFAIDEADAHQQVFRVAERLCVLNCELNLMEAALVAGGSHGADLYATPIQVARRAISPAMLGGNINQAKSYLLAEVRTPFRYMVPALETVESEFEAEDLVELNRLLAQLQESIESSALPPPLLQIVKNHIALLREGLARYPIRGPQALRDALKQMTADLYEHRNILQENQDSPEISKFGALLNKAQAMAAKVSTASDFIAVGAIVYEGGKLIIGFGGTP
ncbi:hypothetical protein ACL9RI_17220 [Janthinobacterium sp. Mn2066]|uniref:hypothetical protein n=1 Tax=Janthinobacterium sp. Mn2066 TaxID=3395264 RepID=UPI003BDD523C